MHILAFDQTTLASRSDWSVLRPLLGQSVVQTLQMVLITIVVGGFLGLILGVILYGTRPGNLFENRYVYRILAAKQLFSAPTTFGFRLRASDLYPPIPYTEVTVTKGIADLARFARSKGINLAILKNMNPWLRETSLSNHSGRTYVIKIPTKEGMTYDPKKTVAHDKRWVIE